MQRIILSILLLSTWHAPTSRSSESAGEAYIFGVFPYLSAVRMESIYAPVSAELHRAMGRPVHFRTASSFKRFFTRLKNQHYDLALIQPFWYPPAIDQFDYLPLVRMEEPFASLIMVLDESPLKKVSDLKGKLIATPPAIVPVVHMAKRALKKQGLIPGQNVKLKAFKSVDSCFQQILIGAASACVAPPFAPAVIEEKMNIRLRVLMKTPSIPSLSLVVHSRVTLGDRERLKELFMTFQGTKEGQKLLGGMKTKRFVPAIDVEYDGVRSFIREIKGE